MAAATVAKNLKDRRQKQSLEEVFKKVKEEKEHEIFVNDKDAGQYDIYYILLYII